MTGNVHSIETLGALDGPGIRTVIFLSGCPMRCKYCHNPDTWAAVPSAQTDARAGKKTVEELTAFCRRYKNYYGKTGGITLSGGEPLLQREFCLALIRALKAEGIRAAVDTGGGVFAPEVLFEADLTILDVKHTDPEAFRALTGMDDTQMRRTLAFLQENKLRFWVRQVIVPGITDTPEQVQALRALAHGAEKIELLPYHTMGIGKWEKLGLQYPIGGVQPPDNALMRRLQAIADGKAYKKE